MAACRLIVRRKEVTKAPVVIDEFKTVEFYDENGVMQAFIQKLGLDAYAFSSSNDEDWEQAKAALGLYNGDIDGETKPDFFKES